MTKSAMVAEILGRRKAAPIFVDFLPIFYVGMTIRSSGAGTYIASVPLNKELPKDIEGKTLYLQGGQEGIEICVLGLPNEKSIEFIYDGELDTDGLQDFFIIKQYEVFPLSKWLAANRAKYHAAKAEIESLRYRLSPLAKLREALYELDISKQNYEYVLDQEDQDRMAGDAPFDKKIALENLEVVTAIAEKSGPIKNELLKYDLLPSATIDQVNALMVRPRLAIIEIALGMKTSEEFNSLAVFSEAVIEDLSDRIDAAIEASASGKETTLAEDLISKDDLPDAIQSDGSEGKPHGDLTPEQSNKLDGAFGESLEQEQPPMI
jgi:hypothetical protein